jgi:hypothetical protein
LVVIMIKENQKVLNTMLFQKISKQLLENMLQAKLKKLCLTLIVMFVKMQKKKWTELF